jgi:hypothetical protein
MGDVLVKRATLSGGQIDKLAVRIEGLPERVIDRDTALAWMRDGHSLIPWVGGARGIALQLVEVDDEKRAIRIDNDKVAEDHLPDLPTV